MLPIWTGQGCAGFLESANFVNYSSAKWEAARPCLRRKMSNVYCCVKTQVQSSEENTEERTRNSAGRLPRCSHNSLPTSTIINTLHRMHAGCVRHASRRRRPACSLHCACKILREQTCSCWAYFSRCIFTPPPVGTGSGVLYSLDFFLSFFLSFFLCLFLCQ